MVKFVSCLLLVVSLAGCGDIISELASLAVSPTSTTVGINKTALFSAVGKDSVGKIVTSSPAWSVEGAIGTIFSTGLFTAGATEGTGNVVAADGSVTAKSAVTVTAKGWLEGTVTSPDSGKVEGLAVSLKGFSALIDTTTSQGKYSIANIPAGTYEVDTAATSLYQAASAEVTIASGETVTKNFSLVLKAGIPSVPTTTLPTF